MGRLACTDMRIFDGATDREQRSCELAPESSRMDGQACLHRHTDIRRATDREQRSCELAPEKRRE